MAKFGSDVKEKKEVLITVDTTEGDVLKLNLDSGVLLKFDSEDFKELPESVVRELRYENQKAYFVALGAKRNPRVEAQGKPEFDFESPLDAGAEEQNAIRKRKGWHQAWIMGKTVSGGEGEVEMRKSLGYKVIRRPAAGKTELPGEESGDIVKRSDFGKSELVAMEIPDGIFQKHLEAMAKQSTASYMGMKRQFAKNVEVLNSRRPKSSRVGIVDDEGDVGS